MILDAATKARMAGAFYVMAVIAAVSGEALVRGRLALALGLLAVACFVVVTVVVYSLFKPVSSAVALAAAASNLVALSLEAFELHFRGANVALIFHGLYCVLVGLLISRSGFLGEGLPMLWLLMIGVNVRVWNGRAHAA